MGEKYAERLAAGEVFARRMREVRERRGWSQQRLSDRLRELGHPLHRVTLAKIEQGGTRARKVPLEDVLAIAAALDVAPLHLFVPFEPSVRLVVGDVAVAPQHARLWVRGRSPLGIERQDMRIFFSELPPEEIQAALAERDRMEALGQFVGMSAPALYVGERAKEES